MQVHKKFYYCLKIVNLLTFNRVIIRSRNILFYTYVNYYVLYKCESLKTRTKILSKKNNIKTNFVLYQYI